MHSVFQARLKPQGLHSWTVESAEESGWKGNQSQIME